MFFARLAASGPAFAAAALLAPQGRRRCSGPGAVPLAAPGLGIGGIRKNLTGPLSLGISMTFGKRKCSSNVFDILLAVSKLTHPLDSHTPLEAPAKTKLRKERLLCA